MRRTTGCPGVQAFIDGDTANIRTDENSNSGGGSGSNRDSTGTPRPFNKNQLNNEQRRAYETQLESEAAAQGGFYRAEFWTTYTGTPPTNVTLSDIASFRPMTGGNYMEPNGWIVVGLDTNFYSDASAQIVNGTLLGLPASVRFSSRSFTWTYGDGSSRSSATPGSSWAAQNVAEFSPTATSHVFDEPGVYTIDLTVEYSAEYRFGASGWVAIPGTLQLPANSITATAADAATVLVNRDCRDNPEGPGC
ncbi:PKD domain-containing protein [Conyzicola sp.]|uniref:PKD domain-containing protein n=1 Tax=Conyzicola sp. TaxID=1969404 RepID=UPI00398A154B